MAPKFNIQAVSGGMAFAEKVRRFYHNCITHANNTYVFINLGYSYAT